MRRQPFCARCRARLATTERPRLVQERKTATGTVTRPPASPRPTIKDVASRCGVHPSTVSRALSPVLSHLVAPEVTKRIRAAAAARIRFVTSGATRWLRTGLSARDTVEGCTPHLDATSLMVGRGEAGGLVTVPVAVLRSCTNRGRSVVARRARQRAQKGCRRILDRSP